MLGELIQGKWRKGAAQQEVGRQSQKRDRKEMILENGLMVLRSGEQQDNAAWEPPTVCPQLERKQGPVFPVEPFHLPGAQFITAQSDPRVSSSKQAAT